MMLQQQISSLANQLLIFVRGPMSDLPLEFEMDER